MQNPLNSTTPGGRPGEAQDYRDATLHRQYITDNQAPHDSQLLEAALAYASHGWPVFPCRPRGKDPLTEHGFKSATADPDVIRTWWERWPNANVGIPTGADTFVALDVDVRDGGDETLHDLLAQYGDLPPTPHCLTGGGGDHYYFQYPEHVVKSAQGVASGIDIKADGGYVIAPPSIHETGWPYAWEVSGHPDDISLAPLPGWLVTLVADEGRASKPGPAAPVETIIPTGQRNATLTSLAGTMRRRGIGEDVILAAIRVVNETQCEKPLPDAEVRTIARSVSRYEPAAPPTEPGYHEPASPPTEPEHLTDLGNARRLVRLHGDDLHYCYPRKQWLVWTGTRWEPDTTGEIVRRAKATVATIYGEAATSDDVDRRKAIAGHAMRSESESRISAMIGLAQSEPGIPVTPGQLDADAWLLNCTNGTVNLRTGELLPHNRDDLITKSTGTEYDPGVTLALWDAFLAHATAGDPELERFLARAAGSTIAGDAREELLYFIHGPTCTGKSTFLEAFKGALGDYALTADFETFLARSFVGGPRPEIARLAGARLVASIEVEEGRRLAEGLLKLLVGGDTVTARHLYHAEFSFVPQFTLWLSANARPQVKHDDAAMWRRIITVPFDVTVPEEKREPTVKASLRDPTIGGSAVLAWLVQGCLDWQRDGLQVPERVRMATAAYRISQDPLREFIAQCCALHEDAWVSASALRASYEAWCEENGVPKPERASSKAWGDGLRERGCKPSLRYVAEKRTRGWSDIRLKTDEDEYV